MRVRAQNPNLTPLAAARKEALDGGHDLFILSYRAVIDWSDLQPADE